MNKEKMQESNDNMSLINKTVKNKRYGQGKIISQNKDTIKVAFEEGTIAKFIVPTSFEKGALVLEKNEEKIKKEDAINFIPLSKFEGNTKERTIMDVIGKTRDENVCSNMLAFYFNPNEEHELGNLVLKALVDILIGKNILTSYQYENIAITRELKTLQGKRMDIVIKNNDCVIGIENKIDATLYNDLNDYAKTLDTISSNAVKIVLSVNKVDTNYQKTGFINITYREFLESLQKTMEKFEYKDKKWYLYLEDFIMNLSESHIEYKVKQNLQKENITLEHSTDYYNDEIQSKVEELAKLIRSKKEDRK